MNEIKRNKNNKETPLRELLEQYTRFWYFFVLSVLIAIGCAFIYLRYATPIYKSTATIIIKDGSNGGVPEELAGLANSGGFSQQSFGNNQMANELALLDSKRLNFETVKALDLNITYSYEGNVKTLELYDNRPFNVKFLSSPDTSKVKKIPVLNIEIISQSQFKLSNASYKSSETYNFGEGIVLPFGTITVIPNTTILDQFIGKAILVQWRPAESVALSYQKRSIISNTVRSSNVVEISIQSELPEKAENYLNELVYQYNQDAINDRNQVARKTSDFIASRLEIIFKELDSVESNKEDFKTQYRLTDIAAEAQLTLENASEFEKRQFDVGTQLELSKNLINYLENTSSYELLPANIGLRTESMSEQVNAYNQLILERNALLKNSTERNPVVENITNQIEQLRSSIKSSLTTTRTNLQLTLRDLNSEEAKLNSRIATVPSKEKIFRGITRQQSIKEQLYLFLLEQREQASIALAVTAPKAKIVDRAYTGKTPIAPQKIVIYLGALAAGLLVPFLILYIRSLLATKVKNRKDVERGISSIPIIGEIPKLKRGQEELIQHNDRSVLAESFRILRTNLQYLFIDKLSQNKKNQNVIMVTSTIKGEGKTFVAFNLALTLATTGKKVVLVGADIRNPQLQRYLPQAVKNNRGVTEFIMDNSVKQSDIALQSVHDNLSIVLSGAIPPNPAELLMQERTATLFEELREAYDFVIIDSAPAMLVTDTMLINGFADVLLYVVRAGYTDKRLLEFPAEAIEDGRLSNMSIVLNNVSMSNFGYGNKYGYAYSEEKPSVWQRFFKF